MFNVTMTNAVIDRSKELVLDKVLEFRNGNWVDAALPLVPLDLPGAGFGTMRVRVWSKFEQDKKKKSLC